MFLAKSVSKVRVGSGRCREQASCSFLQACQFMGLLCVKLSKNFHLVSIKCVFCFVDESSLRSHSEAPSLRAAVRKRS